MLRRGHRQIPEARGRLDEGEGLVDFCGGQAHTVLRGYYSLESGKRGADVKDIFIMFAPLKNGITNKIYLHREKHY